MGSFFQDVRYGFRMLRRNPGFGLTAILILAIGIGANTSVFSIVNSILLKPLPYPDHQRLVMLRDTGDRDTKTPLSYPEFQAWRDHKEIFDSVGSLLCRLRRPYQSRRAAAVRCFEYFRRAPSHVGNASTVGPSFSAEEELQDGPPAVIVSDAFWHNRLHTDPAAVGGTLTLKGKKLSTVVGGLRLLIFQPFADDADLGVALPR